jgi:hypothetical protein
MDVYDFDYGIKLDILDTLLCGRGVSRVKYAPDFEDIEEDAEQVEEQEPEQKLAYEMAVCEHVQWDDFRRGPGKTWDEVRWVAFRHRFSKDAGVEKFGDVFNDVKLDAVKDDEVNKADQATSDLFKTAEVWEIWNKDAKEVLFISRTYKVKPLQVVDDPLGLDGFFPLPRPFYAIEDSNNLVPVPLYEEYKQQADELDRVSSRINNLTDALRVRGVYNAVLTEMSSLQDADDNQLIAAKNALTLGETGGLEKHIWYMPIEMAANVIKILMEQRDACKQVIYEITGLSDIMRAATDPRETFGAQKIKAQWGTQRLKKMQAECQRYIRDIIRLKCQIIANKFQQSTIADMTGMKLLNTEQERMGLQQQAQQFAAYQQSQGQQPPQQMSGMMPPPPKPLTPDQQDLMGKPSWEQVMVMLKDKAHRNYHIDIETDSTIASSIESDMQGMQATLKALNDTIQGMSPLVQEGVLSIDVVKEVALTVSRRARMGLAFEDALEKMQQPKPQPNPEMMKIQATAQTAQQQMQMKAQLDQKIEESRQQFEQAKLQMQAQQEAQKAQLDAQVAQSAQQSQAQQAMQQNQLEAQRELLKTQHEAQLRQLEIDSEERQKQAELDFNRWKAELENTTKIAVAEISAKTSIKTAAMSANAANEDGISEVDDNGDKQAKPSLEQLVEIVNNSLSQMMESHQNILSSNQALAQQMSAPKQISIERGTDGKAVAVNGRTVVRDNNNRIVGVQ